MPDDDAWYSIRTSSKLTRLSQRVFERADWTIILEF